MKKVFIYVGHSNWGKSFALKKLTNNSSKVKRCTINGKHIFVRKMSNDDDSGKLLQFVKKIPQKWQKNFIIAYCPKQDHLAGGQETAKIKEAKDILNELHKSCELYFFVQEEKYDDPQEHIALQETQYLYQIGKQVFILKGQNKDSVRAFEFENFIKQYI
ncbi:hypothetical protein [uncultured Chryseobacterium sp.]|uniref:hypothetical protein n=1 Tax=uncultured Chryseobacterium sp. TaxID=259322 RepID=UPI0025CC14E6|nr:hypothetical protein [uncultured Chryseobacterium sp.]